MKKLIGFIISLVLIVSVAASAQAAEISNGTDRVAGLREKLDALYIRNVLDQETLDEIQRQCQENFDKNWPMTLYGIKNYSHSEMETDSDEAEYELISDRSKLDFDNGILITCMNSFKYGLQYADARHLSYLLSDTRYWSIPAVAYDYARIAYAEDGNGFMNFEAANTATWAGTTFPNSAFAKDPDRIEEMLLEYDETSVSDIQFYHGNARFMYIRCYDREYLIKLYGGEKVPQIELFKMYPAIEVMQEFSEVYPTGTAAAIKPTYTAEGEALMSAGVISGNENGLDPLKPLTRIEALTILVKAFGYGDEQVPAESQFADIPDNHWGAKYANIAVKKGIASGVGGGNFAPDNLVAADQFATLTLKAAGIPEVNTPDFDWQTGMQMLINRGVITAEDASTMDFFTRGDMAKIIYEVREKGLLQ